MNAYTLLLLFFLGFFPTGVSLSQPDAVSDSLYLELDLAHDVNRKIEIYLALSYRMRTKDLELPTELALYTL
jgi:hypothetical protein